MGFEMIFNKAQQDRLGLAECLGSIDIPVPMTDPWDESGIFTYYMQTIKNGSVMGFGLVFTWPVHFSAEMRIG